MGVEVIAAVGAAALVGATLWLLAAGIADRRSAPRATPGWTPQSVLEAAFLVGGPRRVVDTVISSMHEDERIQILPPKRLQVLRPVAADGVEGAVLAACGPEWQADLEEVRAAVMRSPAVQEIGDGLAAHGLLYRPDSIRHWRLAARVQRSTCYLTCVAMVVSPMAMSRSAVRWEPPNMVPAFAVFFGAMGALLIGGLLAPGGRLTKAGRDAVAQLRRSNPWVPTGTAASGPAVAALVAIGGAGVLTPGPLRDELMASAAGPGISGGSGSSSSSSSSPSDPGGATWCGSSGGGGGGGCGASSCGGGSGGGGGSSCGGGSSGGGGSSCSSGSS